MLSNWNIQLSDTIMMKTHFHRDDADRAFLAIYAICDILGLSQKLDLMLLMKIIEFAPSLILSSSETSESCFLNPQWKQILISVIMKFHFPQVSGQVQTLQNYKP